MVASWIAPVANVVGKGIRFAAPAGKHVAKYFPRYTAGMGALGRWDEGPLGWARGAAEGYGTGLLGKSIGGRAVGPATGVASKGLGALGLNQANAALVAKAGLVPAGLGLTLVLHGGGGGGNQSPAGQLTSAVGGGAANVGGLAGTAGVGWVAHNTLTGETIPLGQQGVQDALAPGMGRYGPTGPMGTALDVLDPRGPYYGRRLNTKLDSKTNAEALNILMPTIMKWSEETKRRDLARDMQAAGIRQNIATNAALNQIAAQAGADRGTTASSQLGGAITNKYSFG